MNLSCNTKTSSELLAVLHALGVPDSSVEHLAVDMDAPCLILSQAGIGN